MLLFNTLYLLMRHAIPNDSCSLIIILSLSLFYVLLCWMQDTDSIVNLIAYMQGGTAGEEEGYKTCPGCYHSFCW